MERDKLMGENREMQLALEKQRTEFEFEVDEMKRDFDLEKGRIILERQQVAGEITFTRVNACENI